MLPAPPLLYQKKALEKDDEVVELPTTWPEPLMALALETA